MNLRVDGNSVWPRTRRSLRMGRHCIHPLPHSPTILLIQGTFSVAHLRENIAATNIELPADAVDETRQDRRSLDVCCDSMSVNYPL